MEVSIPNRVLGGFRGGRSSANSSTPIEFQSLIGFWVVFGKSFFAVMASIEFAFQSLIGFWVVFGCLGLDSLKYKVFKVLLRLITTKLPFE